jgi:hypothetical protein
MHHRRLRRVRGLRRRDRRLRIGERIRTATGTDAVVASFTIDPHPANMWDITVAGAHSFFVGSGEVLVHNCANPLRFTGDQQALIDLAKGARRTGLSPTDARTMLDWADEFGLPTGGGFIHQGDHWIVGLPHIHIGGMHIPVIGLP